MRLLEVTGLTGGYGPVPVLRDVSFGADEGGVVTLLGANGAGKTTTLRALSGLVSTRGRIVFDGREITRTSVEARARAGMAHVPEGRGNFSTLTVEENLRLGAYSLRGRAREREGIEHVYSYFPRLAERRRQLAGSLSGGEQQMLAIGRGLMLRPRLLMLDEPSLGLSPRLRREVFDILERISRDEATTLLVVEQNAGSVMRFAHYAYVLETGRVAFEGRPESIEADDGVRRAYLGMI